jgi:hypothetical protein
MMIMTIRVPNHVKVAFDKAFEGEDKDAIIARLLREAAEKPVPALDLAEQRKKAVDAILELRKKFPAISNPYPLAKPRAPAHPTISLSPLSASSRISAGWRAVRPSPSWICLRQE